MLPVLKLGSGGSFVKRLQMGLNGLGLNYNDFAAHGIFDKKTEDVVKNFQDRFQLNRDGVVGPLTWKMLLDNVKAIQRLLNSRGYHAGAADGWYGPATINAVKKFQADNGLKVDGIVRPRTRQKLFNPHPKDHFETRPSSNDISSLNPHVAALAKKFLNLAKTHHLDVRITTAFRSWDDEDRLYAQGRTAPGHIVTNAQGGDSYHNWGLAFDAAPYENGKISTNDAKFNEMGKLGQEVGLEWGGAFKSLSDKPHFQYTYGLDTWDLLNGVRPKNAG